MSWAFNAALTSGFFTLASLALIATTFAASSLFEILNTFADFFASLAFAASNLALMAAFFAGGAANNFFLSSATLLAALSCSFKAAFFSGFLTFASLALMDAIFLASIFLVTYLTFLVALFNAALAAASLALIAAFLAGGALCNFSLSLATLFAAAS